MGSERRLVFALLVILLLLSTLAFSDVVVVADDTCGTVNASKTLTSDITTTGTCFIINASNIILDGAGYTITGNGTNGYGIDNTNGYDNITIQNFGGINNFSTGIRTAWTMGNSTISNNTITTSGDFGLFLLFADSNTISDNTIITTGTNTLGLHLDESHYNTFSGNTYLTSGTTATGVYLELNATNNSFIGTKINATNAYEIDLNSTSTDNKFTNTLLLGSVNFTSHLLRDVAIDVNTTAKPADPSGKRNLSDYLIITNTGAGAFINFNLSYTDSDVSGINESTIMLYRYNESAGAWEAVSGSSVDTASNTVTSGNITGNWALYAPFGDSYPTYADALNITPATFNASALVDLSINWASNANLTGVSIEVNRSGAVAMYPASNITDATLWNLTLNDFPAGTHYWRSNATDDEGKTDTTPWYEFSIAQIAPTLSLTLNGTANSVTISAGSSIWLNGSLTTGDVGTTLNLYLDGASKGDGTSINNFTTFNTLGTFNITLNYTQTQNYSSAMTSYLVTVSPDTCGTLTESKTLTSDITTTGTCFTINASNIILDGNGYTITGDGGIGDSGILNTGGFDNVTIQNFASISNFGQGIRASGMDDSIILNNNVSNNGGLFGYGIHLTSSNGNFIGNNTANSHTDYGIYLDSCNNNTITNNNASGSSYGILLSDSGNNTITNNNASDNYYGIHLDGSDYNTLTSNSMSSNTHDGIWLADSDSNTVENNFADSNGGPGIYISFTSFNNTITGNIASNNTDGIYLSTGPTYNTITGNNFSDNTDGIYLTEADFNTFSDNNVSSNKRYGIYFAGLSAGDNNTIINNTVSSNADHGIWLTGAPAGNWNIVADNTVESNGGYGIYLSETSNNTLESNSLNSNQDGGIIFAGSSDNNLIKDNTIHSNSGYGIYVSGDSNNLLNNDIWNCSDADSACIWLYGGNYNVFDGNKINLSANFGIKIYSSGGTVDYASHNIFKNTNMTNISSNPIDCYTFGGSENLNNRFINFTFDGNVSMDPNCELIVKWYYRAYANDSAGSGLANITVAGYNVTDGSEFSITTNASGWTDITEITEYVNKDGTITHYSNYTINATNGTSVTTHSYNVTSEKNNLEHVFTFDTAAPVFSNAFNETPATFNASSLLHFNITWTDNVGIQTVQAEVNRSGSVTLYTMSNTTATNWNLSLTDFPVGTHYWRSNATDSAGNTNITGWYSFTISKTAPTLSLMLNNTGGSVTIGVGSSIWLNGSVVTGDSGATLTLYLDGVQQNSGTSVVNLTTFATPGTYNISLNYTTTQNYSAATTSYLVTVSADTCGTLTASKTLFSNITTTGTCFKISASNIILDGNGYTITGDGSSAGINFATGCDNITIRNFGGINNFTNGIYVTVTENSTIFNNTIENANVSESLGIYLFASDSNTISSNFISITSERNGSGIQLYYSDYNTFSGNTFLTSGTNASGFSLHYADENNFIGNRFNASNSDELFLEISTDNNRFTNELLMGTVNFTSHLLRDVAIDVNTSSFVPPADPSGKRNLSDYLTIVNQSNGAFIDFNLSYADSEVSDISESTIQMYWYNESSSAWQVLTSSSVDISSNTVSSGNISGNWGLYAPFGELYPIYSDVLNVTPATFDAYAQLNFSINWTSNSSLVGVWIEVNRSGTSTLYQASNMTDATLWNLTLVDFPAGTHYWRSNVTDAEGKTDTTPWYDFTIAKIAPTLNLTLNGTEGNVTITVGSSILLNGTLLTGDVGATLIIYLDGVGQNSGTSVAKLTTFAATGDYNITLNHTMTQNYSAAMVSYFVTVNDITPPAYSAPLNVTPASFNTSRQLNFSIDWTDNFNLTNVWIEVNRSGTLTTYSASNDTGPDTWNLTLTGFPAGTHYWRSNATDSSGNVNTTGWYSFTIAKIAPTLNLTLNGTEGAVTIDEDSSIWLNGSLVTGDTGATLSLYLDGASKSSGASINNLTTFATPGTFNISLNYTTTENYTTAMKSYIVTVNDITPPGYTAELNVTPATFDTSAKLNFSINWTDNFNLTNVWFEVNRSGTLTTYSASNGTGPDTWNISLTDFPAGTHYWRSNATDSSGNLNTTGWYDFTIAKIAAELNIILNGTEMDVNISVGSSIWLNGSVTTGDSKYQIDLWVDTTHKGTGSAAAIANYTAFNTLGTFNISLNYTPTQNYTATRVARYVTVNDLTPPAYSAPLNVTPHTFDASGKLNFSIIWTDNFNLTNVWIEVNRSGTLTTYAASNDTGPDTWNLTLTDFPAGTHYWRSNATDSGGNVNTTGWYDFTISKIAPTISLTLNGSSANIDVEGGDSIWLNGSLVTGDAGATLSLYIDGVQQDTGTNIANLTTFSSLGDSNISLNYTTTQNYTAAMSSYFVTVLDTTPPVVTNLVPIAGTHHINNTNVTLSADITDNVNVSTVWANVTWQNGSMLLSLSLGTAPTYSAVFSNTSELGVYDVTFFANDTSAYLNSTETTWFNVTEAPDTTPPAWSSVSSYPTSPVTYSESVIHLFNVTWTDAYAIDIVLIEHNFTGTLTNYSVTTHAESIYYYNYSSIAVGTYGWRMYANDTANNTNVTSQYTYNVIRATPTLTIANNTPDSTTYGSATNVTCTASSGQVTPVLWRNGTEITNSEAVVLAVGTWSYTCNSSQTANYTNATATQLNIVISKAAPTLNLTLNGTEGAVTIDEDSSIWLNGSLVTGDGGATLTLYLDSVQQNSGTSVANLTTFATPGTFNISLNYTTTQNYSYGMTSYFVTVLDTTPPAYSNEFNETPATFDTTGKLYFNLTWQDNFNLTGVSIEVNRSGTETVHQASNVSATVWNLTLDDFPAGTHYWRSNATDDAGNTNTTPWYDFTISKIAPTINLTLNGTEGNVTIALNSSIWLNGSLFTGDPGATLTLYLDGVQQNSGTSVANLTEFLNPKTYTVSLNYTTTQNYSGALVSYFVTMTGDSCGTLNTGKTLWSNITTTGTCFTINASNIVLDGNGYTITSNGSGYGITATGFNNVTIRNFGGINNFSNAIYASAMNDSTISNNIIQSANVSEAHGILIKLLSSSNTISSNFISTSGSNGNGLLLSNCDNNTLSGNTILTSGTNAAGIFFQYYTNNSFTGNKINATNSYEIYVNPISADSNRFTNTLLMGTVNFTSHSFSKVSIDVNTTAKPADPSAKHNLSDYLSINSTGAGAFINFNLSYAASELSSVNEDSVQLYRYNESVGSWSVVSTSSMDTTSHILSSGNITSFPTDFSLFASFGDKAPVVLSHTPTGTILTATATLNATTDENAVCRYSTSSGTAYASMTSNMSGNTTSHSANLTGLTTAIKHYYIRCNNSAGVVSTTDYDATFTVIYGTDEPPSNGGGGGGGGGAVPPSDDEEEEEEEGTERVRICGENKVLICHQTADGGQHELCVAPSAVEAHFAQGDYLGKCAREGEEGEDLELYQIIEDIIANIPIDIPVNRPDTSLQKVTIEVDEEYTRVEIIFRTGTRPPKGVSRPNRTVRNFIEIDHPDIDNANLVDTSIDFRVERSWLEEQNSTADDVELLRFSDSTWNGLPTHIVNESAEHFFYSADSPGLSVFAIALKPAAPPAPTGAVVGDQYRIWQPSFLRDYLPLIMTIIISIFITMISGYYFVYLRKQIFVKQMEEIRKKSIYVFPDFKTLPKSKFTYLGIIADTDVKTYLDHRQLNMHTLIAGGTGSGKTISGMIIVEELLKRGLSVMVFDPVGQWTGFLEKNRDKQMLEQYRKFSMKSSMAFDGTIIEVTEKTMDLDILHYVGKKGLTIFKLDKLSPQMMDQFIERSLETIHQADLPEESYLKTLIVLDEVHRLLPKYGGRKAHIKLEVAVREFRKWGIGMLMVSQVLTDFKGAIRSNIGTEIQMRTRYEGDLSRVRERNGPKISRLVPKMPVGTALVESIGYNKGLPYFVQFRPLLHSPHKLSTKDIKKHTKGVKPVLLPKARQAKGAKPVLLPKEKRAKKEKAAKKAKSAPKKPKKKR